MVCVETFRNRFDGGPMYMQSESTWQVARAPEAVLGAIAASTPRGQNPTTLRGVPRARTHPTEPPPPARPAPAQDHRFAKTLFGPALRAPAVPTANLRPEVEPAPRVATPLPPQRPSQTDLQAVTTPGFKRPESRVDLDLGLARQTDRAPRPTPPTAVQVDDYIPEPPSRGWARWASLGALVAGCGGLAAWLLG
jgi:hypothetical protein